MTEELKPCPFCGGEAELDWELDDEHGPSAWVFCTDSGHCRRDVSHHPDNRYADPKLRAAYDRGFADRSAEIEAMP